MNRDQQPTDPERGDDAIARYRKHDNPFGDHPRGIGPTLGEDVAEEPAPDAPAAVK